VLCALALTHAFYVELLGKGGLWGAGYDWQFHRHMAVGATVSFVQRDGERTISASPYLALYPLGTPRHRWFAHVGPTFVELDRMSPVPEWGGTSDFGVGAEISSGYEFRSRVIVRAYGMATIGENGIAPWLGVSVGFTL
jgi:hypothetical protein